MKPAKRILVVEDEPIVAISLQDMLGDLGYDVVGPAFRVAAALALTEAEAETIDAAILDVNMAGEDSYAVAYALKARDIPYLFATGYGRQGLEPGHEDVPVLQKPYRESQVKAALKELLG
ncbi:MAG TPA: response regulator [Allosphingosinicella sp.]|jgi:CheY-like chemotaxis protein